MKCKDCGKRLWSNNKDGYCPKCRPFSKCIDCGLTLKRWRTTRCPKCARSLNGKNKDNNGVNNPRYKEGRSLNKILCSDCKKEIDYRCTICSSCSKKKQLAKHNHLLGYSKKGKANGMYGVQRFGRDNPNWKENKIYVEYPIEWTKVYKDNIRKRDNYTCQNCNILELDCKVKLHVHHIDYDKKNCQENNLISLCHNCHAKTTVWKQDKRDFWMNYYNKNKVGV